MDQFALQMLVGGMGTVVVPEYNNDVLTGENTIAKIRAYWQPGRNLGEEWADWMKWYGSRKQFMTVLVQAMRARLESDLRSLNLPRFGKAVLQALNERHIQIYLREPLGSGLTSAANWGGAMTPTASDYLFVVDTNMGFNKVNGLIKQRLDYSVVIDDGGLARSQLLISYEHRGTRDVECLHESYYEITYDLMMDRCYWNYLRIYVPEGATLIADENGNDMENAGIEAGKQVWARWMMMARQDKPQVSMGYYQPLPVLSTTAAGREYRLVVQKQPGTDRTPLRVMVTLPAGVTVLGTRPAATRVAGNIVEFESTLATDQEFRVIIR
jgi:hypothetical protein